MSSKIEHAAKCHAYGKCMSWAGGPGRRAEHGESCLYYNKLQHEKHVEYLEQMKKDGKHYYGTGPDEYGPKWSGFLRIFANWLAHKLLEYAWGKNMLY